MGLAGIWRIIPRDDEKIGPALVVYKIDPNKLFHNRFCILAIIGKGTRGFVLHVSDRATDPHSYCAVKIIFPQTSLRDPQQ